MDGAIPYWLQRNPLVYLLAGFSSDGVKAPRKSSMLICGEFSRGPRTRKSMGKRFDRKRSSVRDFTTSLAAESNNLFFIDHVSLSLGGRMHT